MPYTVTLTKKSVNQKGPTLYDITINAKVSDGTANVIDQDFTVSYNTNSGNWNKFKAELNADMAVIWDKWKAENTVYVSAAFDTALASCQTTATNYTNA